MVTLLVNAWRVRICRAVHIDTRTAVALGALRNKEGISGFCGSSTIRTIQQSATRCGALAVELRHAGLAIEKEVAFEIFHLGECVGRYRADLIVQEKLIVEVKTGPSLESHAVPQLLNYLNVARLPLGLVLYFGPKPKVNRVIRDSTREYPIVEG